jgi:arylsulfatase A-like enzyme
VVSWPQGVAARGEIRSQFHHVIDVAPTILEAAGIPEPQRVHGIDQRPIEGVSMLYSFADGAAPDRHVTQYFEMVGNRGVYHQGGTVTLSVDGTPVGEGRVGATVPMLFSLDETADIGRDTASPVSDDYSGEGSVFGGSVAWVRLDVGEAVHEIPAEDQLRIAFARQ